MWDMFSNSNFQPPLQTSKNLIYKESQHLLSNPVTLPTTEHTPEYPLPEKALKRNKKSSQKHKQNKDARQQARNRWCLAQASTHYWRQSPYTVFLANQRSSYKHISISYPKGICILGRVICITRDEKWMLHFHIRSNKPKVIEPYSLLEICMFISL